MTPILVKSLNSEFNLGPTVTSTVLMLSPNLPSCVRSSREVEFSSAGANAGGLGGQDVCPLPLIGFPNSLTLNYPALFPLSVLKLVK